MTTDNDTEIRSFEQFLRTHKHFLWDYCMRRAHGNSDLCADYLQDITVVLWKRRHGLPADATLSWQRSWIRFVARTHFFRLQRHPLLPVVTMSPEEMDKLADSLAEDPFDPRSELVDDLSACLHSPHREVITLYRLGYHEAEIAKEIHLSVKSIYRLRKEAVELMRAESQQQGIIINDIKE